MITFVCALGALLVFASLFLHGSPVESERSAAPTTAERGANGLAGAMAWLGHEGVRTRSLRGRFDTLVSRTDLPPTGNLLIVATPVVTSFKLAEIKALERWVGAGNTLLVLAALSDRPAWGVAGFVQDDLSYLSGFRFAATDADSRRAEQRARPGASPLALPLAQPLRSTLVANRPHPYLAGVASAVALSDYPPQSFDLKVLQGGLPLSLAHQRETGRGVLWLRAQGAGTVIVSAFGSLFSNRALGLADNARLLGNIVSASLASDGGVLFDDEHQGLGMAYDPQSFFHDPRLYATLGVLLAVWLAWVLGSTRLRLRERQTSAPREAELVRATGMFLARVLRPPAAARSMFAHFFRRLPGGAHGSSPAAAPPWEWLERQPRLARADLAQLRAWYADAWSDRRVPLTRLHNLMVRTERQIAL